MRTSLIAGIWAGIAVGFFSFPLTKNVKRSCDIAVGSWGLAYVATFSYGAYQHNQLQHKLNAASSLPPLDSDSLPPGVLPGVGEQKAVDNLVNLLKKDDEDS